MNAGWKDGGKKTKAKQPRPTPPREKASWRQATATPQARQHWKEHNAGGVLDSATIRRFKLCVYGFLGLSLLGFLLFYVFYHPTPVPLIVFAVTDYQSPIPPNSLAQEDVQRMERVFADYENVDLTIVDSESAQRQHFLSDLRQYLEAASPGGPSTGGLTFFTRGGVCIVYVSAHGVVDADNAPCLILADGDPHDSSTWLKLQDIFQTITTSMGSKGTSTLLVLDAGRISQNWSLGVLYNGFATALQHAAEEHNDPNLMILNASGLGESTQIAPEWPGTPFGYYFTAALRGAGGNGDNEVTLSEVYRYLQQEVGTFARQHRGVTQNPILINSIERECPLAYIEGTYDLAGTTYDELIQAARETGRKKEINLMWERFASLQRQDVVRWDPMSWAELQSQLVRLDQLAWAGAAYDDSYRSVFVAINDFLRYFETKRLLRADQCPSLAMVNAIDPLADDVKKDCQDAFDRWLATLKTPGPEKPVPVPQFDPQQAADISWTFLENQGVTSNNLNAVLRLLDHVKTPLSVEYSEVHLMRMWQDGLDKTNNVAQRLPIAMPVEHQYNAIGAPKDVRSFAWYGDLAASADQQLRTARDDLFVGNATTLASAEGRWKSLLQSGEPRSYATAGNVSKQISEAYRIRDRSLSIAPHLARWMITSKLLVDGPNDESTRDLFASLEQWIRATHQLGQQLETVSGLESRQEDVDSVVETTRRANAAMTTLMTAFNDECREVSLEDITKLRRMELILDVPIVPAEAWRRNKIRDIYLKYRFTSKPSLTGGHRPLSEDANEDTDQISATHIARLLALKSHPVQALLTRSTIDGNISASTQLSSFGSNMDLKVALPHLARMGGEVRSSLASIESTQRQLAKRSLQVESGSSHLRRRLGLGQADRLSRAGASLLIHPTWDEADDPSKLFARLDTHALLMWHGYRVLQDCWGGGAGGEDYYIRRTQGLVVDAGNLFPSGDRWRNALQTERDELRRELNETKKNMAMWNPVAASNVVFVGDELYEQHRISVKDNAAVPAGSAAVFVQDSSRSLLSVLEDPNKAEMIRRRPWKVKEKATFRHYLANADEVRSSSILDAVVYYRGHRRQTSFYVESGNADTVMFTKPRRVLPRVRVVGDARQTSNVLFVLDCSKSMRFLHDFEGRIVNRMYIAGVTLARILQNLNVEDFRVGLMCYGRRTEWKTAYKYTGPVHPGEDVELVFAIGPLLQTDPNKGQEFDVRPRIFRFLDEKLQPKGETPLYFAITKALGQFETRPGPRHVIVITDGADQQSADSPAKALRGVAHVEVALRDRSDNVRLDIIGFSAEPDEFAGPKDRADWDKSKRRWAEGKANLMRLAELSGGSFHDINDPSRLLQAVRHSLRLEQFRVRDIVSSSRVRGTLGEAVVIDGFNEPAAYEASIENSPEARASFDLLGGESITLHYNREQETLHHKRFDEELSDSLRVPRHKPTHFVGAHMPISHIVSERASKERVDFRVSIQNEGERLFSRRPRHCWAEILPLVPDRNQDRPPFYAYDLAVEPLRPVPVLRFPVANWPATAERGTLTVWFTDTSEHLKSLDVDIARTSTTKLEGTTITITPTPAKGEGPFRIVLEEQHEDGLDYPLYIRFSPAPDTVTHNYLSSANRVRHVLFFENAQFWRQAPPRIAYATKGYIKSKWIQAGPLQVELPHR